MKTRTLKMADACAMSGYTRDQIRSLLRDLPKFVYNQSKGRNTTFTRAELLVISVLTELETRYGMKRAAIAKVVDPLLSTLQQPRNLNQAARLNIVFSEGIVNYLPEDVFIQEGLIVPLGPIFRKLDSYLGAIPQDEQLFLSLGPSVVHGKKGYK